MLAVSSGFSPLSLSWGLPGWCLGAAEGLGTHSAEAYAAHIADVGSIQHQLQASGDYRHLLSALWQDRVGCLRKLTSGC